MDWKERAACKNKNTNLFYPEDNRRLKQIRAAKDICETCPVSTNCFWEGIAISSEEGIWGGQLPEERAKILTLLNIQRRFLVDLPTPEQMAQILVRGSPQAKKYLQRLERDY